MCITQQEWPSEKVRNTQKRQALIDTLLWQAFASVIIPGITINRICWTSAATLRRTLPRTPPLIRGWIVTGVGLSSIPLIVKPIDKAVDWALDKTYRKYANSAVNGVIGPTQSE